MKKTKKIWNKAKEVAKDKNRISSVVSNARKKLQRITENSEEFQGFKTKLEILLRMAKSHISGDFKAFSWRTIFLIVFALVYFVIPIDVIPDFLPVLGYSDDISIIYFISQKINDDISRFIAWESGQ